MSHKPFNYGRIRATAVDKALTIADRFWHSGALAPLIIIALRRLLHGITGEGTSIPHIDHFASIHCYSKAYGLDNIKPHDLLH